MAIAQNYPNIVPSLSLDFANVKALDPRITFSRASTATYYGTETAKAEENLLIRSQEFDNAAWLKSNSTIVANSITAPDGSLSGDTFVLNSGASSSIASVRQDVVKSGSSVTYTMTIYAKPAGFNTIRLSPRDPSVGANAATAYFNLETGEVVEAPTASGTYTNASASITVVADDWYRCLLTFTTGSETALRFQFLAYNNGTISATGDGTSGIYVWGAQIEQRDAVTAYTPTTTQPITNFIPVLESEASGVARFDHNPVTKESLGLLIEEQRTNLLLRSEEFDNAGWTKTNSTVTANTIVAPDGTLTGDKLVATATNTPHDIRRSFGATSGKLMVSLYAKKGEFTAIQITSFLNTSEFANFDLSTGTVSRVGPQTPVNQCGIVDVGNGWYRCNAFIAPSGSGIIAFTAIQSPTAGWSEAFSGNGFDGIFIWGAQSENADFPTSYIPTSASQVTRAADAASMTGANFSSWYNAAEGTLYAEAASFATTAFPAVAYADGGGFNNIGLVYGANAVSAIFEVGALAAPAQAAISRTITARSLNSKFAGAYKVNDFAFSANGGAVGTDTLGILPVVNILKIGRLYNDLLPLNGTIRKLSYYPVRVTNAQLQGLTS